MQLPTKCRLFALLVEGVGLARAAERLGIKKSAAHQHALDLEHRDALERIPAPRGQPLLFKRGHRAAEFEAYIRTLGEAGALPASGQSRVGRLPRPATGARVHGERGAGYKFEVVEGPGREVPWAKVWNPNRRGGEPTDFSLHRAIEGRLWRFWLKRSSPVSVLMVQPPPEYVWDERRVATARRERRERVIAVVGAFCKEFDVRLRSFKPVREEALSFAFAAPGVAPFGEPGTDPVWVDESPGAGQSEVETADPLLAAAIMALPRRNVEVDSRFRDAQARIERVASELDAVWGVAQSLLALHERDARNQKALASLLVPTPATKYEPGMEVA